MELWRFGFVEMWIWRCVDVEMEMCRCGDVMWSCGDV